MKTESPPEEFAARFPQHNRQAVISALFCLLGTLVCWQLAWFLTRWLTLFVLSTVLGEEARLPEKLPVAFGLGMAFLYGWGVLEATAHRYRTAEDRPPLGWRAVKDLLLFLPRMTFGIVGNLGAVARLSPDEVNRAWELLLEIRDSERATFSSLAIQESDVRMRMRLLQALQMIGMIDHHSSRDGDFFYLVRSDRVAWLKSLSE